MALVGNIKDFSLVQLLNLVNRGRKTGCLEIRTKEITARVFFAEGKLTNADLSGSQLTFGDALVKSGRLTQEVHEQVIRDFAPRTDKGLALLLEDSGYILRETALDVARGRAVEVVQFLFTLTEGDFRFDQGSSAPDERIPISVSLEAMIIEGSRQIEEWEALQEHIPDLDAVVKFSDQQSERMKNVQLSGDEWKIITQIDGNSSIKSFAQRNGFNDFRIRKIMFGLMSAGLIRLEKPAPTKPVEVREGQKGEKATQRGLVVRIINRLRGL